MKAQKSMAMFTALAAMLSGGLSNGGESYLPQYGTSKNRSPKRKMLSPQAEQLRKRKRRIQHESRRINRLK